MGVRYLINGQVCTTIGCEDRGLAYGDGVFTTIAVYDRRPCLWSRHQQRLQRDCHRLGIAFSAWDKLQREVFALAAAQAQASMKVIITRGQGKRGYRPPPADATQPNRIVILDPRLPSLFDNERQPASLTVCRHRLPDNASLAGLKHLNRLDQVLARSEWDDEYAEGLMLDHNDAVIAGTMSNVFLWSGRQLCTPSLTACGVLGIMRQYVIDQAAANGIAWTEQCVRLDDFYRADSAFFCNALVGLWPIGQINQRPLSVDDVLVVLLQQIINNLHAEHWQNS